MTNEELKQLNTQTFPTNGRGEISAAAVRAYNDATIDYFSDPFGYHMDQHVVDASGLDNDLYYAISIPRNDSAIIRVEIRAEPENSGNPAWGEYAGGGFYLNWAANIVFGLPGSAGVQSLVVDKHDLRYVSSTLVPIGLATFYQSDAARLALWVRGGGIYRVYTSHNVMPVFNPANGVPGGQMDPYTARLSNAVWPAFRSDSAAERIVSGFLYPNTGGVPLQIYCRTWSLTLTADSNSVFQSHLTTQAINPILFTGHYQDTLLNTYVPISTAYIDNTGDLGLRSAIVYRLGNQGLFFRGFRSEMPNGTAVPIVLTIFYFR